MTDCPFCSSTITRTLENDSCIAFFDAFPVSKGHLLIIPKVHKRDFFELSVEEQRDMNALFLAGKEYLETVYFPDGYTIGFNCGEAAGQSVFHCHGHLIPRYVGDTPEPKGGIRGAIPGKMTY